MALPLTGGGCYPNHNANTPVYNDLCSDWKAVEVKAHKEESNVIVTVTGSYKEFEGSYRLTVNANGELAVEYQFKALQNVNPRQWGLVFEAPQDYDRTFWRRKGMWSVYPDDHISRPTGTADLFYQGLPVQTNPRYNLRGRGARILMNWAAMTFGLPAEIFGMQDCVTETGIK